jgi:hypothetical protein
MTPRTFTVTAGQAIALTALAFFVAGLAARIVKQP